MVHLELLGTKRRSLPAGRNLRLREGQAAEVEEIRNHSRVWRASHATVDVNSEVLEQEHKA